MTASHILPCTSTSIAYSTLTAEACIDNQGYVYQPMQHNSNFEHSKSTTVIPEVKNCDNHHGQHLCKKNANSSPRFGCDSSKNKEAGRVSCATTMQMLSHQEVKDVRSTVFRDHPNVTSNSFVNTNDTDTVLTSSELAGQNNYKVENLQHTFAAVSSNHQNINHNFQVARSTQQKQNFVHPNFTSTSLEYLQQQSGQVVEYKVPTLPSEAKFTRLLPEVCLLIHKIKFNVIFFIYNF